MTGNPLVASVQSTTTWYTGTGVLDNAMSVREAIVGGDWAEGIANGAVAALGVLGAIADPLAYAISAGVGWVLEHCGPLEDGLNWLAGNPDLIDSFAATWNNVSEALKKSGDELAAVVASDTAGWVSPTIEAYRDVAAAQVQLISATGVAAAGVGAAVTMGGVVVATVRSTIRDLVSEAIGNIVSKALQAITVVLIPKVVPEIIALVAKWSVRIGNWLRKVVRIISKLADLCKRLKPVFEKADKLNRNLQDGYDNALSKVPGLKVPALNPRDKAVRFPLPTRADGSGIDPHYRQYPRNTVANNLITEGSKPVQDDE